jgi:outer membrane protein
MRLAQLGLAASVLALASHTHTLFAQGGPQSGRVALLSLDEAQRLARENNTDLLAMQNNLRGANASVRSAYGAFLPRMTSSLGSSFQQGGSQLVSGALIGASSDVVQSSYGVGLSMSLSASSFVTPKLQRASRDAIEADITGQQEAVRVSVTQQYLTTLQAQARADLQDTLVKNAEVQLQLAQARTMAGAGTVLDTNRAQVVLGQAQVAALQAHNTAAIEMLRLFQRMGVPAQENVRLTSTFSMTMPAVGLDSLISIALGGNPALESLRSRETVADLGVKNAKGAYMPTFSLSTSWGGHTSQYTNGEYLVERGRQSALSSRASCLAQDSLRVGAGLSSILSQCSLISFTDDNAAALRASNQQYPFDFTKNPRSISAQLSLSLFDGFAREQRVTDAMTSRDDARFAIRSREQALHVEITSAYLTLTASARTVTLQEQNASRARLELGFVQERYRVGSAGFVELADSRAQYERAASDLINAIYDFHKAFAQLESAVGRPLRS